MLPEFPDESVELRIALGLDEHAACAINVGHRADHLYAAHRFEFGRRQSADYALDGVVSRIVASDEAHQRRISPSPRILQAERSAPLDGADRGCERRLAPELR